MESVAARSAAPGARILRSIDAAAVSVWALVGAIVLYLAIDGGGYDIVVRSQVGVVIWWVVLIGAAWGLLPLARPTRAAWVTLGLFGCFVAWTGLGTTWSLSSERSLDELSRVACYLGILLLAITIHRDRERAVRHTMSAIGAAIVVVASLALLSRLRPDLFPSAQQTGTFLPGTRGRLGWPLNYWNALAALVAFGLPLLLALASSARRLLVQAAAAAGIPILVLCGYLTFSRGGAIAAAAAVLVYIALAPERIPKVATALVAGAGSAALIAGAVHRSAVEKGLTSVAARHEGSTLLIAVILVCAGVALVQLGIGLAVRHGTPPRVLTVSRDRARLLLAVGVAVGVVAALAAGAPSGISDGWRDFKHPVSAALTQDSLARFGTASGNGRYEYWKVAVNATSGSHLLTGFGPGTYQLVWLPRAPFGSYVENAHSLYFETFSDLGLIGVALLIGFLVVVLLSAIRLVMRSRHEARTQAAGAAAALVAFCVAAAFDWIWQVPVLPAVFLLLAGAVLAPRIAIGAERRVGSWLVRAGIAGGAVACLIAIAVPLATTNAVRSSQSASAKGDQPLALTDALAATRLESGAASPELQAALVLELQGDFPAALTSARRAVHDEPTNWSNWLIVSRLEAENSNPSAALAAFRRARTLNPHSGVFLQ